MVLGGLNLLRYEKYIPAKYYGKITTLLIYISIACTIFSKKVGNYIIYAAITMGIYAFFKYLKSFIEISKKHKEN